MSFCHHLVSVVCHPFTFHILIFFSENPQPNELKLGRKHKCTPLKGSIPKRKILLSPGTPSSTGLSSPRQSPFSPLQSIGGWKFASVCQTFHYLMYTFWSIHEVEKFLMKHSIAHLPETFRNIWVSHFNY
jgi:hypothetical protein